MKSNKYIVLVLGTLLTTINVFGMVGSVAQYYQKDGPILSAVEDDDFIRARQALEAYKADPRTMTRPDRRGRRRRIGKHLQIIEQLELFIEQAERVEMAERQRLLEELPFHHAEIEEAEARGAARAARAARKRAGELMEERPISRYTVGRYKEITRAADDVARIEEREANIAVDTAGEMPGPQPPLPPFTGELPAAVRELPPRTYPTPSAPPGEEIIELEPVTPIELEPMRPGEAIELQPQPVPERGVIIERTPGLSPALQRAAEQAAEQVIEERSIYVQHAHNIVFYEKLARPNLDDAERELIGDLTDYLADNNTAAIEGMFTISSDVRALYKLAQKAAKHFGYRLIRGGWEIREGRVRFDIPEGEGAGEGEAALRPTGRGQRPTAPRRTRRPAAEESGGFLTPGIHVAPSASSAQEHTRLLQRAQELADTYGENLGYTNPALAADLAAVVEQGENYPDWDEVREIIKEVEEEIQ